MDTPAIGLEVVHNLREAGFTSIDAVVNGDVRELLRVSRIGKTRLRELKTTLETEHGFTDVFTGTIFLCESLTDSEGFLQCEAGVYWCEGISDYEYVRKEMHCSATRSDRPDFATDTKYKKLIGYGVLYDETPADKHGTFHRRIFYIKPYNNPSTRPENVVRPEKVRHLPGQSPKRSS